MILTSVQTDCVSCGARFAVDYSRGTEEAYCSLCQAEHSAAAWEIIAELRAALARRRLARRLHARRLKGAVQA